MRAMATLTIIDSICTNHVISIPEKGSIPTILTHPNQFCAITMGMFMCVERVS